MGKFVPHNRARVERERKALETAHDEMLLKHLAAQRFGPTD
ncbi:MAG: hypothetical protein AB2A00_02305 [Myxococcota bacterium]